MDQLGGGRLFWCQLKHVRHSAEFGKRTGLHLPHQIGAMHLHRRFGDADIAGNLFVEATRHDMEHDLTLAWAERVEALPERSQSPFTLPAGTIASETGLHGVKQVLITEWLCNELHRTALHRLHGHR